MVCQAFAAGLHLECGIALTAFDVSAGVGLARVVGGLRDDVGAAVGGCLDVGDGDDAHLVVADGAVHLGRAVGMGGGVGRGQSGGLAFRVDGLVQGYAAVFADEPVGVAVDAPRGADVGVCAVGIVLAELEALVVLVAPVFGKVVALDAEVVVAAYRRRSMYCRRSSRGRARRCRSGPRLRSSRRTGRR